MLSAVIIFISCALAAANPGLNKRSWNYMPVSTKLTCRNESIANGEVRIGLLSRGNYAFSGFFDINIDVPKETETEVNIYRSTDGGTTYKIEPYSVPRQGFYEVMNSYYKDIIMSSAAKCSNFPQFNDTLEHLAAQKYHFEKCELTTDALPNYLPDSLYKINVQTFGLVELVLEVVVEITQKDLY
ncbi:uncharacterized protein LOC108097744 [Drosophila ficusphila]|uniref:uncharacterized protein LOC108097744 n=1 Tax=Drosophila ficusphila TaxID=30025 RepID=UPI0007E8505F|nr:uncharacterized protein LOC108097744 [Drosophila ficusphila]